MMNKILHASIIATKLSDMVIISDDHSLKMVEFLQRKNLKLNIQKLSNHLNAEVKFNSDSFMIKKAEAQINEYYYDNRKVFDLNVDLSGTEFQIQIWRKLQEIEFGTTSSYKEISTSLGLENAHRAASNAVAANKFAIIIPCHRVVRKNGEIGDYAAGINVKKSLLNHEISKPISTDGAE